MNTHMPLNMENPIGVMIKVMDYNLYVSELEPHLRFNIHFRPSSLKKGIKFLISTPRS